MRLPEPYVFFVDRSLGGRVVAGALRAAGVDVRAHDDVFAQDTDDEVWLADVGDRGWIVLTKDVLIRRDSLQRQVLLAANVAAFVFARGGCQRWGHGGRLRCSASSDEESPATIRRPLHRVGDCQRRGRADPRGCRTDDAAQAPEVIVDRHADEDDVATTIRDPTCNKA